jgi:hypothetical protein
MDAQMINATLNLKFKALQRQGFLNSYNLSVTKCNSGNFPVVDVLPPGHAISEGFIPGGSLPCNELYGTMFGEDPAASFDDYVTVELNPTGATPWLDPGEIMSIFTLNLSAGVRRTDGRTSYPGYGPVQYNLVIQRTP